MTQGQYIIQLEQRVKQLKQQVETGKNAEKEWEEKCQKLEDEKLTLENKIANLEKEYQKLTLAKAIGLTEQQKKDNHLMLTHLIAEIDKCLKLLKESNL